MTTREALTRSQLALHEQDAAGNADVIHFLDQLANALGYVDDAKRYVDKIAAVTSPLEGTHER